MKPPHLAQAPELRSANHDLEPCATSIAIIIPACNEEACIGRVLEELLSVVDPAKYVVAVGVNDSTDRTAGIARRYPVVVTETVARGYGYGCQAAIEAVRNAVPVVDAYLFFAGDGASDPRDVRSLAVAHRQGYDLVLGTRTLRPSNWRAMTLPHVFANLTLGAWCGLLTGRWFTDLAPLRLIDRTLFEKLAPHEMTFGWTVEAQVGAAILRSTIREVPVGERRRLAGEQKVSGVTWGRTLWIGCRILAAGARARCRFRAGTKATERSAPAELLAQSQAGG
ncbi:MAG: glycosyltransferase family 2 protein [Chthoniobacterales bacterium]